MGALLGRFRKKKNTLDQLEKIDSDIKSIEAFQLDTELTRRRIGGYFILISTIIYIIVAIVFYFCFFPATFYYQSLSIAPLLLVPFMIWGIKRLLTWYYRRKLSSNDTRLTSLRTEKNQLLEKVMETETYKVAKTILEKFAPDQLRKGPAPYEITPYKPVLAASPSARSTSFGDNSKLVIAARSQVPGITSRMFTPTTEATPIVPKVSVEGDRQQSLPSVARPPVGLPLVREILPRDRSVLDRLVEYLVGDGPSNRYALICKSCQSHNGMAMREEFEYIAFRCCYCGAMNAARKLRPLAPKLEFDLPKPPAGSSQRRDSTQSTSSSEKNSSTDTESEEREMNRSRKSSEVETVPADLDLDLSNAWEHKKTN